MNDQDNQNETSNQPERDTDTRTQNRIHYPRAFRIQRLAAFLVDNLIVSLALVPFVIPLGLDIEQYADAENPVTIPFELLMKIHILAFVFYVVINGWLLYRYGQTVGKRMLKIAIATMDYQVPPFNRLILVRHLPFVILAVIPSPALNLVNIVNWSFVFREDRRCLHDYLAGTQVIDVSQAG